MLLAIDEMWISMFMILSTRVFVLRDGFQLIKTKIENQTTDKDQNRKKLSQIKVKTP